MAERKRLEQVNSPPEESVAVCNDDVDMTVESFKEKFPCCF